ncbi:MAG TPA: Crp/Fnr family transcriptional regulator [Thermomicrobiales bacterium]|jgi:CRP-like cAMP-binding protein|nr:Crp/Fnr family transcriptional regulator [Thermomicrobiales bacterium]
MTSYGALSDRPRTENSHGHPVAASSSAHPGGRAARSPESGDNAGRAWPASSPLPGRTTTSRPSTETFGAGETVFSPESGVGLVYIIRAGCIRLFKTLPDGRSINVGLLGPNTVFVQEDTTDGLASGTTAEALVPSSLTILAAEDLATLISDSPDLATAVVAGMTRRLTDLQTLVEHLLVRDTSVRLSVTLMSLASKFGRPVADDPDMVEITLPLTHQALANMIGSNRVTVTRKLLEFQRDGVARSLGRNALAVDLDRLQQYAAGDSSQDDADHVPASTYRDAAGR